MIIGHCLCRAIAFACDAAPRWTLNCHCETCRRATSSAMTTWICVPREAFRFTRGVPSYYASSPGVRRGFCARCGSTLSYEGERWPGELHLHVGAFDDPSALAPTGQAFADERLPWLHLG